MLTKQIAVRVTEKFHKQFTRKAKQYGRLSDLVRELLEAYTDGRITIERPTIDLKRKLQ